MPDTPTPHHHTHSEAKIATLFALTVAGGTANCCRWNTKLSQVGIFVHHLPRKMGTGAFQRRRWQRFLPTCSATASHLPHHCLLPAHLRHLWGRSTVCLGKIPPMFGEGLFLEGPPSPRVRPLRALQWHLNGEGPATKIRPSPNASHTFPKHKAPLAQASHDLTQTRHTSPRQGATLPQKDSAEGITSGGYGRSRD